MIGINGKPYIDLDPYLDIEGFKSLHADICQGIAVARPFAKEGTWIQPTYDLSFASYNDNRKTIYDAYQEFKNLDDTHPLKIAGDQLQDKNEIVRFLKTAFGANDPYIYYHIWDGKERKFFLSVIEWIRSINIVDRVHYATLLLCEHNHRPFEHQDLGNMEHREFIHLRSDLSRGFYVWDEEQKKKHYVESYSAWWNEQDWHGGDVSNKQEYSLRIDCSFTEEFKRSIYETN